MTITGTVRGQQGNSISGTVLTFSPQTNYTPGSLAYLIFGYDNSAAGGGDPFVSIIDNVGNDWTDRSVSLGIVNPGAGVNGGCCMRLFTAVVNRLNTTDIITVTFNTATVAKAWVLQELTSDIGCVEFKTKGAVSTGTAGNPSFTSPPMQIGEMLIGAFCHQSNSTLTGDADTLNGTWSALLQGFTTDATSANNIRIGSQRKLQIGAASTQVWDLTISTPLQRIITFSTFLETPGSFGWPKVWNGSAWVRKPMKVWNGTAWVIKPVKRWTGTAWVID